MKDRRLVAVGAVLILAVGLAVLPCLTAQGSADVFGLTSASAAPAAAPTVTAVDPDSVPNDLDMPITIIGSDFSAGLSGTLVITPPMAHIGTTGLEDVAWVNSATLSGIAPWGLDPGVYTVTVFNPGGESGSLTDAFTVTQSIGAWATGGPYGDFVYQIAIHTITPTTLYAAAPAAGIFRSRDGADSWRIVVVQHRHL